MADKVTPSPEDKSISEEAITAKRAESLGQLIRKQALAVLQAQAEHDAAIEGQESAAAKAAGKAAAKGKDK